LATTISVAEILKALLAFNQEHEAA